MTTISPNQINTFALIPGRQVALGQASRQAAVGAFEQNQPGNQTLPSTNRDNVEISQEARNLAREERIGAPHSPPSDPGSDGFAVYGPSNRVRASLAVASPPDRPPPDPGADNFSSRTTGRIESLAVSSPADTPPPDPGTDNLSHRIGPSEPVSNLAVASPPDRPPPDPGTDQ